MAGQADDPLSSGPNHSEVQPPWLPFMLPSVADLFFILILGLLTVGSLAPRLLGDAGTGWHIRNGEQMLRTHAVTRADSFSSTMNGKPWYAWEWLFDCALGAMHHGLGLNGVVWFSAVIIAASFGATFVYLVRRGSSPLLSTLLMVPAIGASAIHLLARPHIVSWLFTVVWFVCLDSAWTGGRAEKRRLYCLPLLMLLWANLHGGFVMGFALLGIYLLAEIVACFQFSDLSKWEAAADHLKRLAVVSGLSLLASFANPYGWKLHLHVYQYLTDRWLMGHIEEFQSPNFHGVAEQCFAALLLISFVALAFGPKRPSLPQVLALLLAVYGGLFSSRNLPVSSLLLVLIVGPILSQTMAASGRFSSYRAFASRMHRLEISNRGHLWPVVATLAVLMVCIHQGRVGPRQWMSARFDPKHFPVQASEVLAQRHIPGPVLSLDSWGGYLIYRLHPQTKVFVDDRHDLYGPEFLKDYLKVIHAAPGWEAGLEAEHVDWVLLPSGSTLANLLKLTGKWNVEYEDGTAVLFSKK